MNNSNKIDNILQHITSLLTRDSDQILLEQLGIGYSQYKILRVLSGGEPVKQRFIADVLGQTEASISRQVGLLLDKQLISKTTDSSNKRIRLIKITPRGKNIVEASNQVLARFHKSVFTDMGEKQQQDMLASLEEIHKQICNIEHSSDVDYFTYLTQG